MMFFPRKRRMETLKRLEKENIENLRKLNEETKKQYLLHKFD